MRNDLLFLSGVGAGAGLLLLLDPAHGRRRRAGLSDAVGRALRETTAVRARLFGLGAATDAPVSDTVLRDRVRARLGHVVSHPRAIATAVSHGRVTLTGAIPRAERHDAVAAIARVAGVQSVDDCLDDAADAETLDTIGRALNGGGSRRWSPTRSLLVGAAVAGGLAAYGMRRAARTQALEW